MSGGIGDDVSRSWGDTESELERRLGTSQELPILKFYREFADEWQSYRREVRQELVEFLEELQNGPCSEEILKKCENHERYYAYRLTRCGAVVYWALEFEGNSVPISTEREKILILAIEFGV